MLRYSWPARFQESSQVLLTWIIIKAEEALLQKCIYTMIFSNPCLAAVIIICQECIISYPHLLDNALPPMTKAECNLVTMEWNSCGLYSSPFSKEKAPVRVSQMGTIIHFECNASSIYLCFIAPPLMAVHFNHELCNLSLYLCYIRLTRWKLNYRLSFPLDIWAQMQLKQCFCLSLLFNVEMFTKIWMCHNFHLHSFT